MDNKTESSYMSGTPRDIAEQLINPGSALMIGDIRQHDCAYVIQVLLMIFFHIWHLLLLPATYPDNQTEIDHLAYLVNKRFCYLGYVVYLHLIDREQLDHPLVTYFARLNVTQLVEIGNLQFTISDRHYLANNHHDYNQGNLRKVINIWDNGGMKILCLVFQIIG